MSNISHVQLPNGTSYDIKDENASQVTELTQAQYDALTPAQKNNGVIYLITDGDNNTLDAASISAVAIDGSDSNVQNLLNTINFTALYGQTSYQNILSALSADKAVMVKDVPYNGDNITVLVNWWDLSENSIEIDSITTAQGDLCDVDITITNEDVWSTTFKSRDPFKLLDFSLTINVTIPSCQKDIANTSIPNVDVSISDELAVDWAVASLAKYEVKDESSNRINVWPVCMFSMNGQKTLRLRMMAAGPNDKVAKNISGAVLLKHR